MVSQINLRFPNELLLDTKDYAKTHGYLNIQEFIRDIVREKVNSNKEDINEDYLIKLQNKDATTFISDKEADELDKRLEEQANLE